MFLLSFLFILICLNCKMLIIVESKREAELQIPPTNLTAPENQKNRKRKFKNISTCSLVVGCFIICFISGVIFTTWSFTSKTAWSNRQAVLFNIWNDTFLSMNSRSTFNCLIFFRRNSIIRREGMKILKCLRTERF